MPNSTQGETALTVSPDTPLLDEQITVRASGLDPGERVTLRAEMVWGDTEFWASAPFEATDNGVVSTADDAPIAGPYEGVQPMGLFWTMRPTDGRPPERVPVPERLPTTISLERNDGTIARTTITRLTRLDGVKRREVDADGVPADLYLPASPGPHPGVILLGGSEGGRPPGVRPWLLASHGYAVLGPAYFGEDGAPSDQLAAVPVEAVERAVAWFSGCESICSEPVGVIGASRGSELGFLLGSRLDAVKTVVGVVPSGLAFQGIRENFWPAETSAWAIADESVPYVPYDFSVRGLLSCAWNILRGKPMRTGWIYSNGITATDPERVAAAEIPVEETGGPILLLAGEDDGLWPSTTLARRLRDRLADAGYEHDVECRTYPDAGHAIRAPYLPTTHRSVTGDGRFKRALGGTPAGYAAADESAWEAILDTLEQCLKATDGG